MKIENNYLKEFLKDDLINLGFDEDSFDIGLDAFIESLNESYPQLVDGINNGDFEKIRFHAHALKGTFANFENENFKNISDLFKKIEFTAKDEKNLEKIKELFIGIKELTKEWILES